MVTITTRSSLATTVPPASREVTPWCTRVQTVLLACGIVAPVLHIVGATVRWFGIAERALIGAWLQWVAVLAIVLLRAQRERLHRLRFNPPSGKTRRTAVRPA